jgi:hypothetical protein
MIDLRTLRDLWTEDGARSVFAELVTHCVRFIQPGARSIRPDPGDDGIDTFVGELDGDLHVWQAKFFCDGIGAAQQSQIRASWRACNESESIKRLVHWTLCVPTELNVAETRWWQGWCKKEMAKSQCQIELWSKSDFVGFSAQPDLANIFACALNRSGSIPNHDAAISAMRGRASHPVRKLPGTSHLRDAIFVKKLEAAGVRQHRAARTAFYNFELLRAAIEQGGQSHETTALEDLQERIYDLWEAKYNAHHPTALGRQLVVAVEEAINAEDQARLRTSLPADVIHKKGGLHYWADICEAGWTADFKSIGRDDEEQEDGD